MAAPAGALTPELLVVGELCVDLIIPLDDAIRFGQHEQLVEATTLTMGSSSAITACGAAALGTSTALVSVRGDDTFGRFLDAELRRLGVATGLVRIDGSRPTGASTHLTLADGERAILTSLGSIGTVTVRMPRLAASTSESVTLPSLEKRDGISTPTTRSGPSASTAIAATSEESMPPERPISTSVKPFLRT